MICVIIVTYNGMEWIQKCLQSVYNSSIRSTVIVVDNGSTDGTQEFILNNYGNIDFIQSEENLGFGKANNVGFKKALETNSDYILLLNQDAYIKHRTLEKLINISQEFPEYGILSPLHLNGEEKDFDHLLKLHLSDQNFNDLLKDIVIDEKFKDIYDIEFINAAIWLLPIKTIRVVGGFNPYFYHYGEDVDFVNRCKYHGLKIGLIPGCYAIHDRKPKTQINPKLWKIRYQALSVNINDTRAMKKAFFQVFMSAIKEAGSLKFPEQHIEYLFYLIFNLKKINKIREKSKKGNFVYLE